jgi:hypothetical protein
MRCRRCAPEILEINLQSVPKRSITEDTEGTESTESGENTEGTETKRY